MGEITSKANRPHQMAWTLSAGLALGAAGNAHAQQAAADSTNQDEAIIVTGHNANLDVVPGRVLDIPQSINVVPAQVIRQQGIASLQEALRNVPGVTLNAGEGGTHGDLVNLRGFSAGDDYFMDGLRDTGLYDRDSFNIESIEVYKGPASTLFGRGSTGGVINQVSKTPHLGNDASLTLTAGNNDENREVADANYQFSQTGAVRIAAMNMNAGVEGRPYVNFERWGIAPSLALGIDTDTQFTLRYLHQQENNLPDYGIPFLFDRPAPVSRSTFYGLPADDEFSTKVDVVTGRFEHKFNDALSFADNARYGHYDFDSRQTAAIYGSANCFSGALPFAGAPSCASVANPVPVTANNPYFPVVGTPIDQVFVLRDRPSSMGTITTWMNSANLTANFAALGGEHTLVAGVELDREEADLVRFANQDTVIPPVSLLDPDPHQAFPGHQTTVTQRPDTRTETIGFVVSDTMHIGEQWDLIGAVRYDRFHAQFDQPLGGSPAHFRRTDDITSPRAAIVYKPTDASSIYFSYGTSFNPSAENLSLSASNQALPPERDHTYELGGKTEVLDRRLALTAAVFDTEMTNARITDPLQPTLQTLAGELHVRGAEIGAQGYITPNWEILAGYTYLDASAEGLVAAGVKGPVPNTAHNQANIWSTYNFQNGWEIGAGLNYVGERKAGTDTLADPGVVRVATVPGYVTADAMVSYVFNDHIRLQLNAYNLADKFYYASSYFTRPNENHVIPGAGRTLLLTLGLSY
jgi:catecholate siderophore receptor